MRQERERLEWERNAFKETGGHDEPEEIKPVGPVHYQNVQHNGKHLLLLLLWLLFVCLFLEVRSHGVGYYSFSAEEEKRQAQLKTLNQLRDDVSEEFQDETTMILLSLSPLSPLSLFRLLTNGLNASS